MANLGRRAPGRVSKNALPIFSGGEGLIKSVAGFIDFHVLLGFICPIS